jgi:hypothetical protein
VAGSGRVDGKKLKGGEGRWVEADKKRKWRRLGRSAEAMGVTG